MGRYFLILMFILFFSCSYFKSMYLVSVANYEYSIGDYQNAIAIYHSLIDSDIESSAFAYYNLGVIYYALGEYESALKVFGLAKESSDLYLKYYIFYNEGIIYYNQGLYQKAINSFKKSLEFNSTSYDAKYNLELAILKFRNPILNKNAKENKLKGLDEKDKAFLRYIENLKETVWLKRVENLEESPYQKDW